MTRLSRLILLFSLAFAVLFIAPAFLGQQSGLYPLMKMGDVVDIFTPLVLLPLYWLLYRMGQEDRLGVGESLAFVVLGALWVEGQGMHLSANSIGHWLKEMEGSHAYALTNFYDEVLSHYIWHLGIVGLSALLLLRQWRNPVSGGRLPLGIVIIAGIVHGLTFFLIVIEAGTAPLGIPFVIIVTLLGLIWGREKLRHQPVTAFFVIAYAVALSFFVGWAVYWGGLPQFSEVGII